jgi:hypothetical protein
MENQDTEIHQSCLPIGLTASVRYCVLCDLVFVGDKETHSIVSGYNHQRRSYTPNGKFEAVHQLVDIATINLTNSQLDQELDDIVAFALGSIEATKPMAKKEPDIDFNIRRIILEYYAKKGGGD